MLRARSTLGVVLSAGGSTRMGEPKALLDLAGRPLICHHVEGLAAVCGRICVVLGAHLAEISALLPPEVDVVVNRAWQRTGPAESLALALIDAQEEQALVTPVDAPPAPRGVLRALLEQPAPAVVSVENRPGHPVLIDVVSARAGLQQGHTLRQILSQAPRCETDWPDALLNLNTPAQWRAYQLRCLGGEGSG